MRVACVSLTTDFGLSDPFVGIMKGVICSVAPSARIIDISHNVPPQDVVTAGLILKQSVSYFPQHTLHVAVVDPGVGSDRDIVIVRTPGAAFLAPDNGLLTYALEGRKIISVNQVTNPHYFLDHVSRTFHGRDIFAPVAGHLCRGVNPHLFGSPAPTLKLLPALPQVIWDGETARGRVVAVDRFGNLLTNLPEASFHGHRIDSVHVKGRVLRGVSPHYAALAEGEPGAIWESTGHLEIYVRNGSAAKVLGAGPGDDVSLVMHS